MAVEIPPAPSVHTQKMAGHAHSCPKCGTNVSLSPEAGDAQRRVRELEAQVQILTDKATAAVDRCADYEDQLRSIKTSQNGPLRSNTSDSLTLSRLSNEEPRPSTANSLSAKQSRFSFLTGRRGSPAQHQQPPAQLPPADTELLEQLEKERALRAKAEDRVRRVDSEIEELSVQLFSQANEMVASERKARAKLEARVEQLEKKDKDKMARLERLEKAVTRIDRVKAMLAAPNAASAPRKL
ncbi:hypothetical protein BDV95DRAFT_489009 [Massariosphaeria phaeospora]|uniref:GDP/GTP exchange factor Sec2 N-terminal domain-containing protein n=1 Tax=Massariosphaeria phaeospora TaxID=100035 RepID=A0A7C8ICL9_9PLEO|nr:hypothetical protein BDV95DRAFT_489009 [Massariosphaeria phaeospora]